MNKEIIPFKKGTVVINICFLRKYSSGSDAERLKNTCKVISFKPYDQSFKYVVCNAYGDDYTCFHYDLLPADEFFHLSNEDAFESLVTCDNLFVTGQKFLLKREYLYSYNSNIILDYQKFKHLFKEIKENATIRTPTSKTNKSKGTDDFSWLGQETGQQDMDSEDRL